MAIEGSTQLIFEQLMRVVQNESNPILVKMAKIGIHAIKMQDPANDQVVRDSHYLSALLLINGIWATSDAEWAEWAEPEVNKADLIARMRSVLRLAFVNPPSSVLD